MKMNKNDFIEVEKADFIAYLEVYGKNKLIGVYYERFTSKVTKLYQKDLNEIEEYLVNKSNISEEKVYFTRLKICQDFMLRC